MSYLVELINSYLPVFVLIVMVVGTIQRNKRMSRIEEVLSDMDQFLDNMVVLQVANPENISEEKGDRFGGRNEEM